MIKTKYVFKKEDIQRIAKTFVGLMQSICHCFASMAAILTIQLLFHYNKRSNRISFTVICYIYS